VTESGKIRKKKNLRAKIKKISKDVVINKKKEEEEEEGIQQPCSLER
jgi:hypothetical protein